MNLFRRWYGLYKLHRTCKYIARELSRMRFNRALAALFKHDDIAAIADQYARSLLEAGSLLMEAKQRVRDAR